MSEYKLLDEWFPNGRGDGRKFVEMPIIHIFEPIIKARLYGSSEESWFVVDRFGRLCAYSDCDVKFKEYVAPKKKVTKYMWAYKCSGYIIQLFARDQEELARHCIPKFNDTIRLDWSATEFDDE